MPTTGSEPIPQTTGGRRETWRDGWLVGWLVRLIFWGKNIQPPRVPTKMTWRPPCDVGEAYPGSFPCIFWFQMDVSKNSGTPKWMVYSGKLYFLLDDLGGEKTPYFWLETPKWGARFLATPVPSPSVNWGFLALASEVMSAILSALSKPVVWQRLGPVFGGRVFVFFFQEQKLTYLTYLMWVFCMTSKKATYIGSFQK